ncbi:MAG: hypothetical protein R3B09_11875 [Nannocystaceae bacterium]
MDARQLLEQLVSEHREKWTSSLQEFRKEAEMIRLIAEKIGVEAPLLPTLPEEASEESAGDDLASLIEPGMFYSMSQTEAAAMYLARVKKARTLDDILEALRKGGATFTGKDPRATLYTQLVRATLKFVKLPTGEFALLDWYEKEKQKRMKSFSDDSRKGRKDTAKNGGSREPESDDTSEEQEEVDAGEP